MSKLFINLEVNYKEKEYLIETNIKEEKIDDILSEFYRSTLDKGPDESKPYEQEKYNIKIQLDLETDTFTMASDTGNSVLSYEFVREAIGNWNLKPTLESKVNKANLSEGKKSKLSKGTWDFLRGVAKEINKSPDPGP